MTIEFASGGGGGANEHVLTIPPWNIATGDYASITYRVPSGTTVHLLEAGAETTAGTVPAGLTAQLVDETNGVTLFSMETGKAVGDPIASVDGPVALSFRADNATGAAQNLIGHFRIEA